MLRWRFKNTLPRPKCYEVSLKCYGWPMRMARGSFERTGCNTKGNWNRAHTHTFRDRFELRCAFPWRVLKPERCNTSPLNACATLAQCKPWPVDAGSKLNCPKPLKYELSVIVTCGIGDAKTNYPAHRSVTRVGPGMWEGRETSEGARVPCFGVRGFGIRIGKNLCLFVCLFVCKLKFSRLHTLKRVSRVLKLICNNLQQLPYNPTPGPALELIRYSSRIKLLFVYVIKFLLKANIPKFSLAC